MPMTIAARDDLAAHLAPFGLSSFRPGQREVIETVLAGQDCLCVMPTGGGKSLCYQLPAVARTALTLVVSPLIALMKDQVDQLQARGLPVTFINSTLSPDEQYAAARADGGRRVPAGLRRAGAVPQRAVSRGGPARASCGCWRSTRRTASASGGTTFGPTTPGWATSAACWAIRRRSP